MSSPLQTQPDSFAQRLFLRTLRHVRPERFALRALLKAQHLLSLALADRLMALRASDDPLLAAASQIEQHTLLIALLREALDLLGARFDKLPERRRPHQTPKRAVKARFPHHVWHLDLTQIQAFLRSGAFSLAVILDSTSRMPLSWRLFHKRHTAEDMIALVDAALAQHGKRRHLIVDQDGAFTAHDFRERMAAWPLNPRFCSADNHRANSRLERFWRTLKHALLRLVPPAETLAASDLERDVQRALVYYARHRPHQGLGGATPAEVYLGLEPAHRRAVQPPRGKRGDPPVPQPATVEYLDGDRRFPFLRQAA